MLKECCKDLSVPRRDIWSHGIDDMLCKVGIVFMLSTLSWCWRSIDSVCRHLVLDSTVSLVYECLEDLLLIEGRKIVRYHMYMYCSCVA